MCRMQLPLPRLNCPLPVTDCPRVEEDLFVPFFTIREFRVALAVGGPHTDAGPVHLQSPAAPLQDAALLPLVRADRQRIDFALR